MSSFEFMSLFEISQMYLVFNSVNSLDRSQDTGWLKFGTYLGYNYMESFLVKIAYALS